jgi:UDP-N-acetylglucosamine acyltransferase
MPTIHPTAIVSPEAQLADTVQVGPFCVLTGPIALAQGVRLIANVHLQGPLTIGEGTILYPGVCVGFEPQDYKFTPSTPTAGVTIGANCLLREHATIHAATNAHTPTSLGNGCFMMAYAHMGHDCHVGNKVIMVNYTGMSGHCEVADNATFSGHVGLHQFVRIGRLAFLSGGVSVGMDVPPFCMANERNRLGGLNLVGMRRNGVSRDEITEVRRAFRDCFRRPLPMDEMVAILEERAANSPAVGEMAAFIRGTKRGICGGMGRPPRVLTTWLQRRRRGEIPDFEEEDAEV